MNIMEIYKKYYLPENLQMHMLRVAACSNLIIDSWNGPEIDKEAIIRVCLLHDMRNIVKIPEGFSKDENFIEIRRKFFEKYGTNDHEINLEIGKSQGMKYCSINPEDINDKTIEIYIEKLKEYELI